jgi:hypothetical protein
MIFSSTSLTGAISRSSELISNSGIPKSSDATLAMVELSSFLLSTSCVTKSLLAERLRLNALGVRWAQEIVAHQPQRQATQIRRCACGCHDVEI